MKRQQKFDHFTALMKFTFIYLAVGVVCVGVMIYKYEVMPLSQKWYTVKYQGEILRCLINFPHYADGKMTRWTGGVNLVECENGKEYLGVTDVEIIKRPDCDCGDRP